jgi:hypothetical protein
MEGFDIQCRYAYHRNSLWSPSTIKLNTTGCEGGPFPKMLVDSTEREISSLGKHGEVIRDVCLHTPSRHVAAGMLNVPHIPPEVTSEYVML